MVFASANHARFFVSERRRKPCKTRGFEVFRRVSYPLDREKSLILVVPIDQVQPRILPPVQPPQDLGGRRPVVGRGGRDHHRQQQPQRVEQQMTLPPADQLAPVEAPRPADLGPLDRLAVDVADLRRRLPPLGLAGLRTQGIDDPLPGAVVAPLLEVVPDGALGQQVVRQQLPLAAGAGLVEQGVEHLADVGRARPAAGLGRRDQRLDDRPLGVGQVGLGGLSHRVVGG